MNKDFKKKKEVYENLIDFGFVGSKENYSLSGKLFKVIYDKKKISTADYLEAWESFLKQKRGMLNLYIHIPYCVKKCHYCFSNSSELTEKKDLEVYLKKIYTYLDFFSDKFGDEVFNNFYMGGGNPSILSEDLLSGLLKKIFSTFNFKEGGERTVENDSRTASREKFKTLKKHGINRVSMGVQSFNQEVLKVNNRLGQTEKGVVEAFEDAKKVGFKSINLDLMIGLYGDDEKSIINSLKKAIAIGPDEISLYPLQPLRGYLNKVYGESREDFFTIRKDLYEKVISEVKRIAKQTDYKLDGYEDKSKDFNDADCIKLKKEDFHEFKTSYVSYSADQINAILGIGKGSHSIIPNHFRCMAVKELEEEPNNYCFSGYNFNAEKQALARMMNVLSNRNKFSIKNFEDDFNSKSVKKIKKTISDLESIGVAKKRGDLVYFSFKNAKERLLYSLFFFPEEDVLKLIDKNSLGIKNGDSCFEKPVQKTSSELTSKINSLWDKFDQEKIKRKEGFLVKNSKEKIEIKLKSGKIDQFWLSEETIFIKTWLNQRKGFKKISSQEIDASDLKKGDSLNIHLKKEKAKAILCEKMAVVK